MADFLVLFYQSRQIIDVGEAKRSLRALFVLKIVKTCKKEKKIVNQEHRKVLELSVLLQICPLQKVSKDHRCTRYLLEENYFE